MALSIPTQIHFNTSPPVEANFIPLEEVYYSDEKLDVKPRSALWSSSLCNNYGSDWLRFISQNKYRHQSVCNIEAVPYLVIPNVDARIYTIESNDDVESLQANYGSEDGWAYNYYGIAIDWTEFAKDYQAVRLADYDLIESWDCDSTAWLDWDAFTIKEFTDTPITNVMRNRIESLVRYFKEIDRNDDSSW